MVIRTARPRVSFSCRRSRPSAAGARPPASPWLLAVALWLAGSVSAVAQGPREHWYRIEIDGTAAGWTTTRESRAGGLVTTESETELRLRRGGSEQRLAMSTRVVETEDGKPLEVWSRQLLGRLPVEVRYALGGDEIVVTTRQGDAETETRRPHPPADWLPPAAATAAVARRLAAGADSFTLRTIDPLLGVTPFDVDWTLLARGVELEAGGETHLTSRWRQVASLSPELASQVHLTADGLPVRSTVPMAGMTMTVTLAPRSKALAGIGAPELMAATFVRPDRPIRRPRRARRAVYELRAADGAILPELPSTAVQSVEQRDGWARIVVDTGAAAGGDRDPGGDYLGSSIFVDHHHPRVRRLLAAALPQPAAGAAAAVRAETLRNFVSRHLEDKSLDLLLATASEVAAGRSGDCTEHSVLLAALLRADGIPSRLVTGLVYVDRFAGQGDVFGHHMWTQAWIGGRWIDLDASLPEGFDATHIALATTALADGHDVVLELGKVAPLIGNIEIRVLEVEPNN